MTRGESAAKVIDRWAAMELELDRLRKQVFSTEEERIHMEKLLDEANELLKKGQETMRAHAGALVEAAEALAAKNKELDRLRTQLAEENAALVAESRELEFWIEESDRYRDQAVMLLRLLAVERARAGVS